MEVFLIGIIVAIVKLVGMAQIIPGLALWSFALLIVTLAAAAANMDSRLSGTEWNTRDDGYADDSGGCRACLVVTVAAC